MRIWIIFCIIFTPINTFKMNYLKNIKHLMTARAVKVDLLAVSVGKSVPTFYRYLDGRTSMDVNTLILIAEYFHVSVSSLLGDDDKALSVSVAEDEPEYLKQCKQCAMYERIIDAKDETIKLLEDKVELLANCSAYRANSVG